MENETNLVAFAPAVGTGLMARVMGKLLEDEQRIVEECAQAVHDGLTAMTPRRWDKDTETWIQDPDCRVRVQTLFGLAAQADGEPIKRVIHEVRKTAEMAEVLTSPAAIEAAERMIAGAKAKLRRAGVKLGPRPADVPMEVE